MNCWIQTILKDITVISKATSFELDLNPGTISLFATPMSVMPLAPD